VVAVVKERQKEPAPPPLGVVLGFSTARDGLVPELLQSRPGGRDIRWLNLAGSGGSFYELAYYVRPLFESQLDPELLVLAVHPVWLAGRATKLELVNATPAEVAAALCRRDTDLAEKGAREWSWLAFNNNRLSLAAREVMASVREDVFAGLERPLDSLFPPAADPWKVERLYSGRATDEARNTQMKAWEQFGWFDPAQFSTQGIEAEALTAVVRAALENAERVVIVWLPEGEVLRARVPAEAERVFREVLGTVERAPPIVDLRAALGEELFYDHAHVNEAGRAVLSGLLLDAW
jgi:hypothetical protein